MKAKKNIITIKKEELRIKKRSGVIQTKIISDKTKYSRKFKHKKNLTND